MPADLEVKLGDLWAGIDGVVYPIVTSRPGFLKILSPALLLSGIGHHGGPTASPLDKAETFGVARADLHATISPTDRYARFEIAVVASLSLARTLGLRNHYVADALYTIRVVVYPDVCHEGPPARVELSQDTCFFSDEKSQSLCGLSLPIKPDEIIRVGPITVHLAVDGGGPCTENL